MAFILMGTVLRPSWCRWCGVETRGDDGRRHAPIDFLLHQPASRSI